jgi:hypothetical protein
MSRISELVSRIYPKDREDLTQKKWEIIPDEFHNAKMMKEAEELLNGSYFSSFEFGRFVDTLIELTGGEATKENDRVNKVSNQISDGQYSIRLRYSHPGNNELNSAKVLIETDAGMKDKLESGDHMYEKLRYSVFDPKTGVIISESEWEESESRAFCRQLYQLTVPPKDFIVQD